MASNRIDNGLAAIEAAGFALLKTRIDREMKITKRLRDQKSVIEKGLSLGGFRGVIRPLKTKKVTDLRMLCRGVMLAYHVLVGTSLAALKKTYKGKSEAQLKTALRQLDSSATPKNTGMGPTYRSSDGRHHYIIDQTKGSSCGPACTRMVVKQVLNEIVGEAEMRQHIERHEGGTVSTLTSETNTATKGSHDWGNHGAQGRGYGGQGTWDVDAALAAMKIKTESLPAGNATNNLLRTTYKKPGIAVVQWGDGSLHWVVVAGRIKGGNNVLILDPACGLFEVNPNAAQPQYVTDDGATGTLTGRMVLVKGKTV